MAQRTNSTTMESDSPLCYLFYLGILCICNQERKVPLQLSLIKRMTALLTPKDVSKILVLRYNKILELIKLGQLKAIRIGKSFRITEHDLHDFIEKNRYKSHW